MLRYFLKRLMFLIPVLLGVSVVIFSIVHLAPGDPAEVMLGPSATQEEISSLREQLGLTKPLYVQYGIFLTNALKGDLGRSIKSNAPVVDEIMERFPATLTLAVLGMIFAIVIGLPLGILAALKQNTWVDALCSFFALVGFSIPNFWVGLMLMLLLSIYIPILPSSGFDSWKNFIMPTIVLGIQTMAVIARMTRSSMLEVIRQDYVRTARAKGISHNKVIRRHALKNSLLPTITVAGLQVGALLSGAVVTETVFSWPGIGRFLVSSISWRDTPCVLGCVVIFVLTFSIINLIVDILYGFVDPRIKAIYKKA